MVLLATLATVTASQAVICGAFSVTRQAVQLGFLPQLRIRHTSKAEGQIYAPAINVLLYVAVVALVSASDPPRVSPPPTASPSPVRWRSTRSSSFVVARMLWRKPLWLVLPSAAAFLIVDLAFFSAKLPKVVEGGWFPLLLALIVFTLLTTWQRGRALRHGQARGGRGLLRDFVEEVRTMETAGLPRSGDRRLLDGGQGRFAARAA